MYVAHDAWLRSMGATGWCGQLDLDEYIVLPPTARCALWRIRITRIRACFCA